MLNTSGNSVILTWIPQVEIEGGDNYLSMSYSIKENVKTFPSEKYKIFF